MTWAHYVVSTLAILSGSVTLILGVVCLLDVLGGWRLLRDWSGLIFSVYLTALGVLLFTAGMEVWP